LQSEIKRAAFCRLSSLLMVANLSLRTPPRNSRKLVDAISGGSVQLVDGAL
jgi:hypothetical protein